MTQTAEGPVLLGKFRQRINFGAARSSRPRFTRVVVIAAVLQVVPLLVSNTTLLTIDNACIYALAAIGLNIIFGMGGLISIGQAGVMAVGGYAAMIVFNHSLGIGPALLVACCFGGVTSLLMGLVGARVRTHYFILASLAIAEAILLVATNASGLTGGGNGQALAGEGVILGFNLSSIDGFFRVGSVLVLVGVYLADALRSSRLGLGLSALTMNEHMALASGVNPHSARAVATGVGGVFAAVAGAFLAFLDGYLGPQDFDISTATLLLLIVVVGGRARNGSIVLAAVIMTFLSQGFLTLEAVGQLIYGLGLIILIIFAPSGLYGIAKWLRDLPRKYATSGLGGFRGGLQ
jgi:branched-chain amino acid transport system permease protein